MAVAYRNAWTGRVVTRDEPDQQLEAARKWQRVEVSEPSPVEPVPRPAETEPTPFDPSEHTVGEVNDYLARCAGLDDGERERVLQAEAEGKGRVRILTGPYSDLSGA